MKWAGCYEGYSLDSFRTDCISGLIVGIIAIPLGMAFAIASGVKPEYGIYTTIIAGILVSLLGGSRYQIAGFMAGIMLVLMGICRLGLAVVVKDFRNHGGLILISGVQPQPKDVMQRTGLYEYIGHPSFFEHTGGRHRLRVDAIRR